MKNLTKNLINAEYLNGGLDTLDLTWNSYNKTYTYANLFYVLDGEFYLVIDNKKHLVKQGDMVLIPKDIEHSYFLTEKEQLTKYWFHFNILNNQDNFLNGIIFPNIIHIGKNDEIINAFKEITCLKRNDSILQHLLETSVITYLVYFYLNHSGFIVKESGLDTLDKTIRYINNNYNYEFSLKQLSDMTNYSPTHLIKKFKDKTGYSPLKYINVVRINAAKDKLFLTEDPINIIMEECGFFSAAHFSKIFKSYTGLSPENYRRMMVINENKRKEISRQQKKNKNRK